MARQVIHYKSAEKTPASISQLKGKFHLHFCADRECRLVYTDACEDVRTNGRCHIHRKMRRPIWVSARDPQECCIGNCVTVTDVKRLVKYGLAGTGPWFQCTRCARAHGWPCN